MNEKREKYLKQEKGKINSLSRFPVEGLPHTNRLILEVLDSLAELKSILLYPPKKENPVSIITQQKTVTTAGIAEQLPPLEIPFDCAVVIKALSTNTKKVYIGKSKLDAEDTTKSFPLRINDTIEYKIRNLSVLWVNVEVSGEGIYWTVEQEEEE